MKTASYHSTNLGSFAFATGYVTYHVSPRYAKATDEQLAEWTNSKLKAVRNAARTEQAERAIREWRKGN